ncbi:hypothetical protein K525DRAFT_257470 [Schizophyllum commune Loenen D]|nr:hypothetical protein K525DRAFT_257470 [Schizophyllum commune Loenen D]
MSSLRTLTRALPRTTCRSYAPRVRLIQTSAKAAAGTAGRDTRLALLGGTAIGLFATSLLWKSQQPLHLDAPPAEKEEDVVVDPETNIAFPKTMHIESKVRIPDMTLLGVGVRKVSFLKVKVYSIGFYADLSNPNLKIPEGATPEEKLEYLVHNTTCCVRIIPYRNTNNHHLRDAFVRALQLRLNEAIRDKALDEDAGLNASANIRKVKTMFPNVSLNAGSPLDVLLAPPVPGKPRVAIFRDLGTVEDEFTSTEFFMQYFRERDALPSPPLKERVIASLPA